MFEIAFDRGELAALERTLEGMPRKLQRRVLTKSLRASAKPVVKLARSFVKPHEQSRQLRRSLGTKLKHYRSGVSTILIKPRKGFEYTDARGRHKDPRKYAHLFERGTKRSRAHRFLLASLRNNEQTIKALFFSAFRKSINDLVR